MVRNQVTGFLHFCPSSWYSVLSSFILVLCSFYVSQLLMFTKNETPSRRVCVIGAGIAGLASARYLKSEGIDFTVLEATRYVGGTWRYDDHVGTDENGLPLYTSMYKHLRTNLPKPTMELKDFPMPNGTRSYPSWEVYYNYLKSYAKHFDLEKHIQFLHQVISVRRVEDTWKVRHKHVPTEKEFEEEFDYVIVGSGHFSKPVLPNLKNEHLFKGSIIHSHNYKVPDRYKDRRVLIIGIGPSGADIGVDVAAVSKTLIHSHHLKVKFRTKYPEHYKMKSDVQEFNETGALFVDGTFEELDDVIYCTGYQYYYPFLDETSGLDLKPQRVTPLYNYVVNANQPTMMVMGLVVRACLVVALDAQARYATAIIKGNFTLPSKEDMLQEWQNRADNLKSQGRPESHIHILDQFEDAYYAGLTNQAGISRVPPVLARIRLDVAMTRRENFYTFRDREYVILDHENFLRKWENE